MALNLVTACIGLLNCRYLDRAIADLRRRGAVIDEQRLRRLSPLRWDHINLTGDYVWSESATYDADGPPATQQRAGGSGGGVLARLSREINASNIGNASLKNQLFIKRLFSMLQTRHFRGVSRVNFRQVFCMGSIRQNCRGHSRHNPATNNRKSCDAH